ncbi:uncharacterized protein [Dermacentor andersoni]|uniref:uncharacterized protein n=1 Tax=Dermacentor andersoni TaxID=34620 RepID=UPI003B3BDBA2
MQGPARQWGIGKRPNQSYNSTNCEMSLSLVLCKEPALHYRISQLKDKHNHSLDLYNIYPQKRLLSSTEKAELYDLVKCNVAPKDFKNLVRQKTGKTLTTKDVYNYKMEYSIPIRTQEAHGEMLIHQIESLIEKNPDWLIHYEKNNENNLQFILIQTSHMREMFEKYPEVIFVDGTYKVNRENYVLYSILVEDGRGHGRCVCYAFVRNETTAVVRPMFEKFVDFNPFVIAACKVVMIDKDMNELRILSSLLPNSTILLCTWHVLNCLHRNVDEKAKAQGKLLLPILKELVYSQTLQEYYDKLPHLMQIAPKDFLAYYMQQWHSCRQMWVHAYRKELPTLGNNTNNRIESHNQKLKSFLKPSLHLVEAVAELVNYVNNDSISLEFAQLKEIKLNLNVTCIDEFQMELSHSCTVEAKDKILEQYEKLKTANYQVSQSSNSYSVALGSKEYNVAQSFDSCTCTFHGQYGLPCAHIMAARSFSGRELFDKACIPQRWRNEHFLDHSCMTSSTGSKVTSSVQPLPSIKLDTPQQKYCYAYETLCNMSKAVANVLANCSTQELMEKLASCEAFFRNLNTFTQNQVPVTLQTKINQTQPTVQASPANVVGKTVNTKLIIPVVKARRGRPKKVKAVKRVFQPQQSRITLATIKADMLQIYKSYSLTEDDLNALMRGGSLSDSVINIAQYLTKRKFPNVQGFQDVLLGQRLRFSQVTGMFVQILHVRNPDHWLTVTNIGASQDEIFVYDSIDQDTSPDAIKQVCHILKSPSPNKTFLTKPAQNQGTTLDCGLFAIANMYYIASGKDPSQLNINQSMLRSHLLKCLQKGTIDDFPVTNTLTVHVRQRNTTYNLHCLCRQPADTTVGKTINCGACSKIYHVHCLGKWAENLNGKVALCSKACLDIVKEKMRAKAV